MGDTQATNPMGNADQLKLSDIQTPEDGLRILATIITRKCVTAHRNEYSKQETERKVDPVNQEGNR